MTSHASSKTLIQERESTPTGQQGLAAARLAMRVRTLLHQGLEVNGITQKELADRLSVGESRVSQVLSGNGNIQVSTLAKVMRGLGYLLEVNAVPVDETVAPMPQRRARQGPRREKKLVKDTVVVTRGGSSGVSTGTIDFLVPADDQGAFYEARGLHETSRRPAKNKIGIAWEEIDWNIEVNVVGTSSRKESLIGESKAH